MDALWQDLDTGDGVWENVPACVRQGFRALLTRAQADGGERAQSHANLTTRCAELEAQLAEQQRHNQAVEQQLQHVAHTLANDLRNVDTRVTALYRKVEERDGNMDAVASRLATIADAHTQTRDKMARLESAVTELDASHRAFTAEAQAGVIAATQAANEARAAVGAAVTAMTAHTRSYASVEAVEALQQGISQVHREVDALSASLAAKADVEEVNQVLQTKANKVTVAAALHKKLSTSKIPDALSPVVSRIADVEQRLAALTATTAALAPAVHGSGSMIANNASSQAALDERLKSVEARLHARVDDIAAVLTTRTTSTDVLTVQEQIETLKVELRALQRSRRSSSVDVGAPASTSMEREILQMRRELAELRSTSAGPRGRQLQSNRHAYVDGDSLSDSEPAAARSRSRSVHRDALQIELRCTQDELSALTKEVTGILDLLAASDVELHRTAAADVARSLRHAKRADSTSSRAVPGPRISAATAASALRGEVHSLSDRMGALESDVDVLRHDVTNARADALEAKDSLLRHASLLRTLEATCDALQRRVDGSGAPPTARPAALAPAPSSPKSGRSARSPPRSRAAAAYFAPHTAAGDVHTAMTPGSAGARWRDTRTPSAGLPRAGSVGASAPLQPGSS